MRNVTMNTTPRPPRDQQGSMMLEALIALLIFSMGILAIVGLQAASIKNTADAQYRSEASFYANQILGRMWVDQTNLASYVVTGQSIAGLPNGQRTVALNGDEVTVTVTWQPPGTSTPHNFVTVARITN